MAGAGLAVWTAPQVLGAKRASAATTVMMEIDPATCLMVTTTNPAIVGGCAPGGWTAGVQPPVGMPAFTVTRNNGVDCTNGFTLDVDPTCAILEGLAEEMCPFASPPTNACVQGAITADNLTIVFPDNAGPSGCLYVGFRLLVTCSGSF